MAVAAAQPNSSLVDEAILGSWAWPAWSTMKTIDAVAGTSALETEGGTTGPGWKRPF